MNALQTPNSNGKTDDKNNKAYFWTFLSPIKFWAAYGYWLCLICYTYLLASGLLGPRIPFLESLCPFDWGCSDEVYLFFFALPAFFLILMGIVVWGAIKKNKTFLIAGIIHIALIILLSSFVNDMTDGIFWASR